MKHCKAMADNTQVLPPFTFITPYVAPLIPKYLVWAYQDLAAEIWNVMKLWSLSSFSYCVLYLQQI